MNRRGFLQGLAGILASGVAPAAIGSNVLMPIRKLWTPPAMAWTAFVENGSKFVIYVQAVSAEDGRWMPVKEEVLPGEKRQFFIPASNHQSIIVEGIGGGGGGIQRHATFDRR